MQRFNPHFSLLLKGASDTVTLRLYLSKVARNDCSHLYDETKPHVADGSACAAHATGSYSEIDRCSAFI